MTSGIKVLATKRDAPSSLPRIYIVKREKQLPQVVFFIPYRVCVHVSI